MVQHTIYIIRHGNSMGNKMNAILSQDKDILTDLGKKQAGDLGTALADVKFTKVYSSDYSRTLETSELILSNSNNNKSVPIQKEIRLREKQCGAHEGQPYTNGFKEAAALLEQGKDFFEWYPENAETWEAMMERSDSFFSELCSLLDTSENPETVMLTSHGFLIMTFMRHLKYSEKLELSNWNDRAMKLFRNCSYAKFAVEGRPDGFACKKRPLNIEKCHEWGHLDTNDGLIELTKTPHGKHFQSCVQT